jgi:hypothetical protein
LNSWYPDRPHLDAWRLHIRQQERNALVFRRIGVGAHQEEAPIGVVRAGRPDLLTVDDVVITIADGPGLQAGEVTTGPRFAVTLAPGDVGVRNSREVFCLLLRRPVDDERRANHTHVEDAAGVRGAGVGDLLAEDHLLDVAPGEAAVLLRPRGGDPALGGKFLRERHLLRPVLLARGPHGAGAAVRPEGTFEEATDLGSKGVVFF